VLLRSVNLLDMGPCAAYYAFKINRFLFWGPAALDPATICDAPGQVLLEGV
jgi:hypothetical protein